MNNQFKAQSLNRKPTGNSRSHILASRALNLAGYFDQSARSIESWCVVIYDYLCVSLVTLKYMWNCDPAEVYSADRSPGHVHPFPTPPYNKYGRIHV